MRDNRMASALLLATREGYPYDVSILASRHWRAVNGDGLPPGVDHVLTAYSLRFGTPRALRALPLDHARDPCAAIFALTRSQLSRVWLYASVPRREYAAVISGILAAEIEGLRLHEHVRGDGAATRATAKELLRFNFTLARKARLASLRNFLSESEE